MVGNLHIGTLRRIVIVGLLAKEQWKVKSKPGRYQKLMTVSTFTATRCNEGNPLAHSQDIAVYSTQT